MNWKQAIVNEGIAIRHFILDNRYLATLVYAKPILNNGNEALCYGFSCVSKKDQPIMNRGREIAYARYNKAKQGKNKEFLGCNEFFKKTGIILDKYGKVRSDSLKALIGVYRSRKLTEKTHQWNGHR